MTTRVLTPEEMIANVRDVCVRFVRRVTDYHGRTVAEARHAVNMARTHRWGRGRERKISEWLSDAWAAVAALDHLLDLKRRQAAGLLVAEEIDDETPF